MTKNDASFLLTIEIMRETFFNIITILDYLLIIHHEKLLM